MSISRKMAPAALLVVFGLGVVACDTAPDEITIRNESGQTLDVFLQTSDEPATFSWLDAPDRFWALMESFLARIGSRSGS